MSRSGTAVNVWRRSCSQRAGSWCSVARIWAPIDPSYCSPTSRDPCPCFLFCALEHESGNCSGQRHRILGLGALQEERLVVKQPDVFIEKRALLVLLKDA